MTRAPEEKSWALEILEELPRETTLYTIIRHVSRSGMSRVIDVFVYRSGDLQRLWAPELGRRIDRDHGGYVSRGCGMDMAFELVYSLGMLAHGDGRWFTNRTL